MITIKRFDSRSGRKKDKRYVRYNGMAIGYIQLNPMSDVGGYTFYLMGNTKSHHNINQFQFQSFDNVAEVKKTFRKHFKLDD